VLDTLASQSALVAVIVAIATTIALLLRASRPLTVRFASFAASVAAYYAGILGAALSSDPDVMLAARVMAAGAIVITATVFFDAILGEVSGVARRRRRLPFVLGGLVMVVGATPAVRELWVSLACAAIVFAMLLLRVRGVLARAARVDSAAERTRLRYLGVGGVIALVSNVLDLGELMAVGTPAVGGIVVAVYLYFISQALLVSRLLDLHELLGKALVFGTLSLLLAIVYGALNVWIGDRRGLFLSNTLVASSLILILFEPAKATLEEAAARIFFREQLTFARGLRKLVRELQTVIELPAAVNQALDEIYDSKRATHAGVYLLERDGMGFVLHGHRGPAGTKLLDAKANPGLFAHLLKVQTPLLREAVARRLGTDGRSARPRDTLTEGDKDKELKQPPAPASHDEAILRGLDTLKADLVLPLRSQGGVVGLLCLRDERLADAYASDEIAALMEVADQLAITIENSRLFGLLRERDRLAALGEMSAGLAHEIRNPLAAIKGAAQELDPSRIGGDDGELMQIIIDEVNRLNSVVSEFLDYARPFRGTFVALSVNDAVRRTAQLMQHDLRSNGSDVELTVELAEDLPDVNGDAERLQQVLINLILNAADAMKRHGRISLSTRKSADMTDAALWTLKEPRQFVEVRVKDEGPGISQPLLDQIFIPFFTTKARGTGLGLALCQRIVQHHGGSLEVRSVEGHGATFVIRLPALPAKKREADTAAAPAPGAPGAPIGT
jgi:two-component system, NtrC family, sensor histidine kinase HydH